MLEKPLPQQTIQYLNQVLGDEAMHVTGAGVATSLPYFLRDAYEIIHGKLFGRGVALACAKGGQTLSAQQISKHLLRLREQLDVPVIVSLPAVAPGERRQLIRHGVPFVVPGHQLYAPQIGVILSERFPMQARREVEQLSPSTQALLIWYLLQYPVQETWHPFEDAAALGYTAMTATRAVRELLHFKLFELETRGRAKHLKLIGTRRELWEKAKPYLRTPVARTLWTYDRRMLEDPGMRLAGGSALAMMSMVNEPEQTVIAVQPEAIKTARQNGVFFEPRAVKDGIEVQVWRYLPTMQDRKPHVDPLSLWLSFRSDTDDRIQMGLDEIEEKFPW